MQRVLVNDHKVKPYKITKRQLLNDTTKEKRYERSKMLLNKLLDGMWPQVLWTDEKLFTVQAIHNSQNDRIWIESKDLVPFECRTSFRRQKPASVKVWAGVTSTGLKIPLIFIKAGVKINQNAFLNMLKGKVVPWVKKVTGNKGIILHQDRATPHTARLVQNWCKDNFKSFWPKELWSPFSPDLNPMDFGVWSILQQKSCAVSHSSVEALKQKLTKSWKEIDAKTVSVTCDQVIPRLCRVIKEKGGYIE